MGAARLPFFISSTQYKKIVSKGIKPRRQKKLDRKSANPAAVCRARGQPVFYPPGTAKLLRPSRKKSYALRVL